jgi:TPR repeat protein
MLRPFLALFWLALVAASPVTDEARRLLSERRDAEAYQRVESASRRGDVDATALLGWFYDAGRHVPRDYARAAEIYRRVARENPSVTWRLGVMHDEGQGVPADPEEAVRLFRRAAAENDPNAHASLGVMYVNGRGVRTDYSLAMRHARRAAELGSAAGYFGVAWLYHYGLGVARSTDEAAAWYLAAHAMRDFRARDQITGLRLDAAATARAVSRANQLLQSYRRRERVADPT